MAELTFKASVYCDINDPTVVFDPEDPHKERFHFDEVEIPIPNDCEYRSRSTRIWTNNGKNRHRIRFRRRQSDDKVTGVIWQVYVKTQDFLGPRSWRGLKVSVVVEGPSPPGSTVSEPIEEHEGEGEQTASGE